MDAPRAGPPRPARPHRRPASPVVAGDLTPLYRGPRSVRLRGTRARRWVVERTRSWLHRFRALLVRWDKQTTNYEGSLHLACAYLTFARAGLLG